MRLATYRHGSGSRVGVVDGGRVIPVAEDMIAFLEAGTGELEKARAIGRTATETMQLDKTTLLAPIPRPRRNIFCVGWNYSEHFLEGKQFRGAGAAPENVPDHPALFTKNPGAVIGPD